MARRLASEGASLVLTGRKAEVLSSLGEELGAEVVACDLSDREALRELIERSRDTDILVNNAALPASGDILELTVEQIDRGLEVNLRAPVVLARELGAAMAERRHGHIVLISSLSGKTSSPRTSMYSASKFGLRGFGQGLRYDMAERGVGVSVIFPGFISDAGMFADADIELPRGMGTSTPEQVADALVIAITKNKGELDVAPLAMKAATAFAEVFPGPAHALTQRFGGDLAKNLTDKQVDKR
jgi:short-subunit dehydrogenase